MCVERLDVLEMPSGEHNGETITGLLETVLRFQETVLRLWRNYFETLGKLF